MKCLELFETKIQLHYTDEAIYALRSKRSNEMTPKNDGKDSVKHEENTMSTSMSQHASLLVTDVEIVDCLIQCEDMSINVLDRINNIYTKDSNPYILQQVTGMAKIALKVLPKSGKKIMAEIIDRIGPAGEDKTIDINANLGELVNIFDGELKSLIKHCEKLSEDEHEDILDAVGGLYLARYSFVILYESLFSNNKVNPEIAVLKIHAIEKIYTTKILAVIVDIILERQDSTKV